MIVFCDTETTGLIPDEGHLLEIAFIVTDDTLAERGSLSVVVKPVSMQIEEVKMPLFVREMHEKSGLLADVASNKVMRLHEAEAHIIAWFTELFGRIEDLKKIALAGNTISFDRRWLRHHVPKIEDLFSYRSIDVSSLTELAQRWSPSAYANRPKAEKGVAHRALDDVRASIETLRYYRERGFVAGCK